MDPNEVYAQIKASLMAMDDAMSNEAYLNAATDLFNHVTSLDEWLSKGGFFPEAWTDKVTE